MSSLPSGYGSQALALKYLGVPFEHWKICEWAVKSIQAYKDIHFTNDNEDYSMLNNLYYEKLIDILYNYGISQNYNEPMTLEQIKRLGENQVRKIFNNIVATHNLVNIQKVKGYSLEIEDTDKYDYILTYSFPCQDLSLAGKGKGMSDTSTRSGMLWEVERILQECKDLGTLPEILLMENVSQIHSVDNLDDFNKWKLRLEELGYQNYFQDLIATDYGIPQTRNRCFMISILGDYSYTFPRPIPLKLKLKDMIEDNVDEKYYLSDKMKQYIFSEDDKYKVNKNSLKLNRDIACSKTTREGWTRANTSDYITDEVINTYDEYNHKINGNETIGTIQAMYPVPNHGHRLIINNLRIRKLTPRECGRLMGVKDEDITNLLKNQSDSSAYHLFGDSIVVNVIEAIIKQML